MRDVFIYYWGDDKKSTELRPLMDPLPMPRRIDEYLLRISGTPKYSERGVKIKNKTAKLVSIPAMKVGGEGGG